MPHMYMCLDLNEKIYKNTVTLEVWREWTRYVNTPSELKIELQSFSKSSSYLLQVTSSGLVHGDTKYNQWYNLVLT